MVRSFIVEKDRSKQLCGALGNEWRKLPYRRQR